LAVVLAATALEAVALDTVVLWAAPAVAMCFFAVEGLPPELVWAAAIRAAGTATRAAMRQIRVAVFQLTFRAMYCASPRGL
jgi:hypothetical protein